MSRNIAIVSAKGGVGKTVTSINLLASMSEFSNDVMALDADIKLSGLALQLGMCSFPKTLNDVLKGKVSLLEALYIHSTGLRIIPASLCAEDVNLNKLKNVLNNPALYGKTILVDSPPGLEKNSQTVLKSCDEAILVTLPEIPSVVDVIKTIEFATNNGCKPLGIIVNRYRKKQSEELTIQEIQSACGLSVIGIIPEDKKVLKSIFKRIPVVFLHPNSPSSREFKRIAHHLSGRQYYQKNSIINRFIRRIKP